MSNPFGAGPFGVAAFGPLTHELAGVALISFMPAGEIALAWAVPQQMCEPGTWTLTSLPAGPPNDQLELAA